MEDPARVRVNWKSVAAYYAVACLWSWPFYWRRDILHVPDTPITTISKLLIHWGLMWGPGIAALLCMAAFRRSHHRVITLGGNSWGRSILFYAAPFLLLAAFRVHVLYAYDRPALIAAFPMFVSILGEELGWRLSSRRPSPLVAGQEVCLDWRVVGVLALHDKDRARVVFAKDRGNVVNFLFGRDSS